MPNKIDKNHMQATNWCYTWRGLGFWSTGRIRITTSDSILKYPNTSHWGTETWRRIFWSISSTVIGLLLVTCKKMLTVYKFMFFHYRTQRLKSCCVVIQMEQLLETNCCKLRNLHRLYLIHTKLHDLACKR